MNFRSDIELTFDGKAFERPLFYSYPGGLRFELSESGSPLEQFLLAMRKGMEICGDVFHSQNSILICLRQHAKASPFAHRKTIAELKSADISIPAERSIWLSPVEKEDRFDENEEEWWINIAFRAPVTLLQNFLWCAFTTDFPCIRPWPHCMIYLFNIDQGVMVWPYDDRGMDIVGPNHEFLTALYRKHKKYLLNHDLATMQETFAPSKPVLK